MDNASLAEAAIDNVPLATLAQLSSTHQMWICLSPVSVFTNLLIVFTVVFSKKELHNKSHLIIVSYSLAELTYGLAHFGTGLARYIPYVQHVPYTANQLVCIVRQIPVVLGSAITQIFLGALAFDRLICIGLPIKYSQLKLKKYVGFINCFCWVYSFLRVFITFIDNDENKLLPVCNQALALSPRVNKATSPIYTSFGRRDSIRVRVLSDYHVH